MNTEEKLDLMLRTGAAFLSSGANSNRVENAIMTTAGLVGLPREHVHLHMNLRTIMLSVEEDGRFVTKFRKVLHLAVDMWRIRDLQNKLDALTEARANGRIDAKTAKEELSAALDRVTPKVKSPAVILGVGVACAGFCCFLGGDWLAMIFAGTGAALGLTLRRRMLAAHANNYLTTILCACLAGLIASPYLLLAEPSHKNGVSMAASVLFLIPGVPLLNAFDDLIGGFTIMGVGRLTNALLQILSISFGLLVAVGILRACGVELAAI